MNENIGYIINETAPSESGIRAKVIGEKFGKLIVEAVLQDLNKKNRNGRFYEDGELTPQVTCKRTQELIRTGNMKGENGHPNSKDLVRQQTIDPNNVVCKFLKIWVDGNYIKAHVTATPDGKGDDFENALRCEELPSFSMRSLGTIKNTSRGAEVQNIKLITWDRVIYPSHECAYTCESGMVRNENGIYVPEQPNGSKLYLEENDQGIVIPFNTPQVVNYIKSQSKNIKTIKESMEMFFDDFEVIDEGRKVKMVSNSGNIVVVNLETYIRNEIMDYCS